MCTFSLGGVSRNDVKDILASGGGSSGSTAWGMVSWLSTHQPLLHIWENVPDLVQHKNFENLEWLLRTVARAGYACAYGLFRSVRFGHPTRRERAYGVCLNFKKLGMTLSAAATLAQKLIDYALTTFGCMPDPLVIPLRMYILPSTSSWVMSKLAHLAALKKARDQQDQKQARALADWPIKTSTFCRDRKINYSTLTAPAHISNTEYYRSLPAREQQLIAAHCHVDGAMGMTALDSAPCVTRTRPVREATLATVLPDSRLSLFAPVVPEIRCLTGFEALNLTGVPAAAMNAFLKGSHSMDQVAVDTLFHNMGGNAFSGGCVLSIFMAAFTLLDPRTFQPSAHAESSSTSVGSHPSEDISR